MGKDTTESNSGSHQDHLDLKHFQIPDWPVAIVWNTSTCPIPIFPPIEDVINNIKEALYDRLESCNEANVQYFSAFGSSIPDEAIIDAFRRGGVTFELVEGRKTNDIVISIWAALFWLIYHNRRPWVIVAIFDDGFLNPFFHRLVQLGCIVINVLHGKLDYNHPHAGHFVWKWCFVAGGCPLPGPKSTIPKKSSNNYMKQHEEHPFNQNLSDPSNIPVVIYWDIENCQVPKNVNPKDVTSNMLEFLREDKGIIGPVRKIITFADVANKNINKDVKKFCHSTGVIFQHVPGGADAADIALLDDLSWFIFYNSPPYTIILISGDADFVPFLLQLEECGYNVILVTPTNVLEKRRKIGLSIWEWPRFAHGSLLAILRTLLLKYDPNEIYQEALRVREEKKKKKNKHVME